LLFLRVISRSSFFRLSSEKNNLRIRVLAGFLEFYVLKQGAKFIPIPGALAGFWRGANLPYFGKRDNIWAFFPHEPKRRVLRGFPVEVWKSVGETEPETGLFSLMFQTLIFQVSSIEDRRGEEFI
jgi:hypothetical protein